MSNGPRKARSGGRKRNTAFDRVGVKVTRGRCQCGAKVRMAFTSERLEHFMVCPAVDAAITRREPTDIDLGAVAVGAAALRA